MRAGKQAGNERWRELASSYGNTTQSNFVDPTANEHEAFIK